MSKKEKEEGVVISITNECRGICDVAAPELCSYKDIEEELGINLITLFKALRENGIWVKNNYNTTFHLEPMYIKVEIDCGKPLFASIVLKKLYYEDLDGIMDTTGEEWFMDEYGKTWALTKEELLK